MHGTIEEGNGPDGLPLLEQLLPLLPGTPGPYQGPCPDHQEENRQYCKNTGSNFQMTTVQWVLPILCSKLKFSEYYWGFNV